MIIKNIVACATLLLVALTSQGQNIDSLNELMRDKRGTDGVEILLLTTMNLICLASRREQSIMSDDELIKGGYRT